jgi:SEC-C motif
VRKRLISMPRRSTGAARPDGGSPCASISSSTTSPAFSITRKRRKSFPSESQVRRGDRVVHGDVEVAEKLGRNDLCPCGSGRRFQTLLLGIRTLRRRQPRLLFLGSDGPASKDGWFYLSLIKVCRFGAARSGESGTHNNGAGGMDSVLACFARPRKTRPILVVALLDPAAVLLLAAASARR